VTPNDSTSKMIGYDISLISKKPHNLTFSSTLMATLDTLQTKKKLGGKIYSAFKVMSHHMILAKILAKRWNILNYLVLSLPDADASLLNIALEDKKYFLIDSDGYTPLDYVLDFSKTNESRKLGVLKFFAAFFKLMPNFIDLSTLDRARMLIKLSRHFHTILHTQPLSATLSYISCFNLTPEDCFESTDQLYIQGTLAKGSNKAFIPLEEYHASQSKLDPYVRGGGYAVLQYSVVGIPLCYDLSATETFKLLTKLDGIDENKFFESPLIKHVIDYFWKKSKRTLFVFLGIYMIPLGLVTAFSIVRANYPVAATVLLILLMITNSMFLFFECLGYLHDTSGIGHSLFHRSWKLSSGSHSFVDPSHDH